MWREGVKGGEAELVWGADEVKDEESTEAGHTMDACGRRGWAGGERLMRGCALVAACAGKGVECGAGAAAAPAWPRSTALFGTVPARPSATDASLPRPSISPSPSPASPAHTVV